MVFLKIFDHSRVLFLSVLVCLSVLSVLSLNLIKYYPTGNTRMKIQKSNWCNQQSAFDMGQDIQEWTK